MGCVCVQGLSTLQASRDFNTQLTWTAGMNSQKTANAAATTPRKSRSRTASQVPDGGRQQEVDSVGRPGTKGCQSKPCSVLCCVSVCIDRAVFASIEDSDSDLDNHGEDSSSNTSADDHMTTKRSECCLHGAGVKEVRGQNSNPSPQTCASTVCTDRNTPFFSPGVRGWDRPWQQLCVSSLHAGLQQPREAHLTRLPGEAEPLKISHRLREALLNASLSRASV